MTTVIKATCPDCGDVELAPIEVTLIAPPPPRLAWYTFRCPECSACVHKDATAAAVRCLAEAGIEPEWIPAEVLESHAGPPIGYDDLLDLHLELDTYPTAEARP